MQKCQKYTPEYYSEACFCAKRARFTLLTQYVFNGAIKDNEEYKNIYDSLRKEVKMNFIELLRKLTPVSRKLFLVLLLYFPKLCAVIGKVRKL